MTTVSPSLTPELRILADELREAERLRRPIPTPSATNAALTVGDAYEIQRFNIGVREAAGERRVGRKIGLTSLAMQQQLGVDSPDFGVITDAMVVPDGGELDAAALIAPRVEAEFAFRIGRDLHPSPSAEELADAVDGVAVALEIIDSRVADWKIGLVDTVADNASSARIVTGGFVAPTRSLLAALPEAIVTMRRDGEQVAAGPGSAVLGDPLVSLRWLADAIGAFGDAFQAGDVVLAGAVDRAAPLAPGQSWEASAEGFPAVAFRTLPMTTAQGGA
ncbi:2-keto-4-pentenoate hydratase [Microbacterium thalassium]|uniref:2-keto-4-pentenoate hydratase n=1 Tax=Microbacterium thalassium TaxID=362649 RepID=A0A7X0KT72_9MICO|nr:fumarylacetoacetate hydrolase family protein [Microbacterium thalassium]MBB6389821.1 2-keto-4-pentenoate hydratase [Microbacterium thalassium]